MQIENSLKLETTLKVDEPMAFSHYKKDVRHLSMIDVYRVLELFNVTDQAIGHAVKKLLCAGVRGGKDREQDYREAVASINRALQMIAENDNKSPSGRGL